MTISGSPIRKIFLIIALIIASALALSPAHAKADGPVNFQVCSQTDLFVALGWQDRTGWHSSGWTEVANNCKIFPITAPRLYYHYITAAMSNCICPPPAPNPQEDGGVMLAQTNAAFRFDNADQPQGDASMVWFNPVLFTKNGLSVATFTGLDKLVISGSLNGPTGNESLYVHQISAVMPLP